jgi:hypothetical protein
MSTNVSRHTYNLGTEYCKLSMDMHIVYGNNQIAKSINTKFTCFIMGNTLPWKEHDVWLMPKLGLPCYAIMAVNPYVTRNYLHFSYSHCYDLLYNFVKQFSP